MNERRRYGPPPIDEVVSRAAALAAAFRERGLPVVVLVSVAGGAPGRTDAAAAASPTAPSRPAPRPMPPSWSTN